LKNTISNGALMQISARLARYLNDDMYADWATKLWDWMVHVGLIDTNTWDIYDNTESIQKNCTTIDKTQWTYNAGILLASCATMYNYVNRIHPPRFQRANSEQTEDKIWANRTQSLLDRIEYNFFPNGIMTERCEGSKVGCNNDQHSFKAYLSRWMAATTQMAPFTYNKILRLLRSSAVAAAQQCSGGPDGKQCGLQWHQNSTFDGDLGPGQQMAAMEVFLGTLVKMQQIPLTNKTGGTSPSNPNAGYNKSDVPPGMIVEPPKTGDRVGAWFLTVVFVVVAIWGLWVLSFDSWEPRREEGVISEKKMKDLKGKGVDRGSLGVLPMIEELPKPLAPVPLYRGGTQHT
jgi:mannan endo-1,6-alpha-mannosidase